MSYNKINKLVIWGAGRTGRLAYYYYCDEYDVIHYVDSNKNKWGHLLNGISICDPSEAFTESCDVVIALNSDVETIVHSLSANKCINSIRIFGVNDRVCSKETIEGQRRCFNCFFVSFSGGIGNQLFQYALFRCLELDGNEVYANIDKYNKPSSRQFLLQHVFDKIDIKYANDLDEDRYRTELFGSSRSRSFIDYTEDYSIDMKKEAPKHLLDFTSGIIKGTHQTCFFAEKIKSKLIDSLSFRESDDKVLQKVSEEIISCNSVSIHFRLTDYTSGLAECSYGGICTQIYYEKAVKYIIENVDNPVFYVFSDDIEYVKKNYMIPDAIYVEHNMFDSYEDWYDLFLMSRCMHNIIANSSFSWWGAWLNKNPGKIVLHPAKWVNTFEYIDIYPEDWITV